MEIEFIPKGRHQYDVLIDGTPKQDLTVVRKTMKVGVKFRTTFNIEKAGSVVFKKLKSFHEVKQKISAI